MEIRSVTAHRPGQAYLRIQSQCVIAVQARPRLNHPQNLEFLMVSDPIETVYLLSTPSHRRCRTLGPKWPS